MVARCVVRAEAVVVIAVGSLALCSAAFGQPTILREDARLKIVNRISLVVDEPTAADRECGIREESLRLAAAAPLLDAKIPVDAGTTLSSNLYVEFVTIRPSNVCATSVILELRTFVRAQTLLEILNQKVPEAAPSETLLWGEMRLWRQTSVLSSAQNGEHANRLASEVRTLVAELATKIRLVQR
jgi:hypothetical protein